MPVLVVEFFYFAVSFTEGRDCVGLSLLGFSFDLDLAVDAIFVEVMATLKHDE